MHDNLLLIFLKAPVSGKVKTRLALTRGEEEAARIYKEMAQDIFHRFRGLPGISTVVAYERAQEFPDLIWLDEHNPSFVEQEGNGLGERLENAFRWAFALGAKRVAAIGGDSPGLPVDWLTQAFKKLERGHLVLGPAEDGGYYLIGMNHLEPDLFVDIPWSTSQVFNRTLEKIKERGLPFFLLPAYFDVDDEKSLKRWRERNDRVVVGNHFV
ncbi:MAG: TIGR04282 family arsenosugar biosynthesis glycosyltransferase [Elusimicrobia bacterium]|nr:TIGR04282 family arsenosugar biosynthesis glycosyltransferase [Elusimicrobiota bacterium]